MAKSHARTMAVDFKFESYIFQVVLRRQGSLGSIEIDGGQVKRGRSEGLTQTLNTEGNIFLGGAPNPRGMTQGKYSDSFVGCIHTLRIQGSEPINLNEEAVTAVNVGPCIR